MRYNFRILFYKLWNQKYRIVFPNGNWVRSVDDTYILGIPSEKVILIGIKEELENFGVDFNALTEDKEDQFRDHFYGFIHIMINENAFRKIHLKSTDYTYLKIQYYGFDIPVDEYEM